MKKEREYFRTCGRQYYGVHRRQKRQNQQSIYLSALQHPCLKKKGDPAVTAANGVRITQGSRPALTFNSNVTLE